MRAGHRGNMKCVMLFADFPDQSGMHDLVGNVGSHDELFSQVRKSLGAIVASCQFDQVEGVVTDRSVDGLVRFPGQAWCCSDAGRRNSGTRGRAHLDGGQIAHRGVTALERGHNCPVREERQRLQQPPFISGMVIQAPLRQIPARASAASHASMYMSRKPGPREVAFPPLPSKEAEVIHLGWFRAGKHVYAQ